MYISQEDVAQYHRDGYLLVEDMFTPEEVQKMLAAVENGERVSNTIVEIKAGAGNPNKVAIWRELTDDIWSAASTCPRIVNNVRILMGEEIAFFAGKVILKEARSGGAWEWHQDFGYWYTGWVFPQMMSVFIALDPATTKNGCLRVIKGSHKAGRLQHQKSGDGEQIEADPARISRIQGILETVHCEMKPGSALFFHCNLLHTSSANESDEHRRAFITCYHALNNPRMFEGKLVERGSCPVGRDEAILESLF